MQIPITIYYSESKLNCNCYVIYNCEIDSSLLGSPILGVGYILYCRDGHLSLYQVLHLE